MMAEFNELINFWELGFSTTLPAGYRDRNPHEVQDYAVKAFLSRYDWLNDSFGLLIMGKAGVGKTWILTAIMNDVLKACYEFKEKMTTNVAYYPVNYLIYQLRNREKEIFEKALSVSWLFLDDFGTENVTDFAREHFFMLLDLRCQKKKPTFITTNLTMNEIGAKYGERFVSRLKEMCIPMVIAGDDRRAQISSIRAGQFRERKDKSTAVEALEKQIQKNRGAV